MADWTAYNNIDVTNLDSIRFNMNVTVNGGSIEVRVGSPTGNIYWLQENVNVQSARPAIPEEDSGERFIYSNQNKYIGDHTDHKPLYLFIVNLKHLQPIQNILHTQLQQM